MYAKSRQDRVKIGSIRGSQQQQQQQQGWQDLLTTHKPADVHTDTHTHTLSLSLSLTHSLSH